MNVNPPNVVAPNSHPFAKAITSYPTPNIQDHILREIVDTRQGTYTPLTYGTMFDSVKHTAFEQSFPNHQLVWQGPVGNDDALVQRIWVNNRADQDGYNYSLKYAEEDPEFPTYVRTYTVPREGYEPLDSLSPDPVDPDALLTHEEVVNQTDPAELNSKYIQVVRIYETLPGPIVTSGDFDTDLNIMVYTDRQVVLSTDTADPSANDLILDLKETPRSKYTKTRITSYLLELPEAKTEYKTGRYPFPALVYDISIAQLEIAPEGSETREEVEWYPVQRSAPNVPALFKVTTSFYTTEPGTETLYALATRDLIYRGISFQISIGNVLNDEITVATEFSGDGRYGDLAENHTFLASTPSATEYTALIGTYQKVGCDITRWRGQIWVKQVQEVLFI